jgi:kynureninase
MPAVDALPLGPYPDELGYAEALERDAVDLLRPYRDRFVSTDPELIYLDGNSLGRLPSSTPALLDRVTNDQWGGRLIRAWNEGWWDLGVRLGDRLAPLIGARQGEVIISESTTVNLYKLAMAAVGAADNDRTRIVTDDLNFPSDVHVLAGVARATGRSMEIVTSDGIHGPLEALARCLDDNTALVSLSHTAFKSGYTYDLAEVTGMAHAVGALVLWDCSHSVGAVPIDLRGATADLT